VAHEAKRASFGTGEEYPKAGMHLTHHGQCEGRCFDQEP
jgi:hypothetical protein